MQADKGWFLGKEKPSLHFIAETFLALTLSPQKSRISLNLQVLGLFESY